MLGVKFKLAKDWHTYWENPGDAGEGATIDWILPKGLEASSILWPGPERIPVEPLMTFGYNNEVILLTKISSTNDIEFPVNIEAKVGWFTCKDICIPQEGIVDIQINEGLFVSSSYREEINDYLVTVPGDFSQDYRIEKLDGSFFLQTDISDGEHFDDIYFFPKEYGLTSYAGEQIYDCLLYTSDAADE